MIAAGTRELDRSGPDKTLAAGLFSDLHSVPWIAMELVDESNDREMIPAANHG